MLICDASLPVCHNAPLALSKRRTRFELSATAPTVLVPIKICVEIDAVTCELPAMPKLTLLASPNNTVPVDAVCVPAAIATSGPVPPATIDAVIVDPTMPNETLLALEKTTVPDGANVVPAEITISGKVNGIYGAGVYAVTSASPELPGAAQIPNTAVTHAYGSS